MYFKNKEKRECKKFDICLNNPKMGTNIELCLQFWMKISLGSTQWKLRINTIAFILTYVDTRKALTCMYSLMCFKMWAFCIYFCATCNKNICITYNVSQNPSFIYVNDQINFLTIVISSILYFFQTIFAFELHKCNERRKTNVNLNM